jgi:hypothetical protein
LSVNIKEAKSRRRCVNAKDEVVEPAFTCDSWSYNRNVAPAHRPGDANVSYPVVMMVGAMLTTPRRTGDNGH